MSALQTLVKRCDDMDITEQLNIFDDAFLPSKAAAELEALRSRLDTALDLLVVPDHLQDSEWMEKYKALIEWWKASEVWLSRTS